MTRNKRMANGILKQLNQSLEITVQHGLDGLADFTLQLAYTSSTQFEILSIDNTTNTSSNLTLVNTPATDIASIPVARRQHHG